MNTQANNDTYRKLAYSLRILQTGQTEKAQRLLEKLSGEDAGNAAVFNALGAVYYEQGNLPAAKAALERCVALDTEHPLAHATLGEIALREKDGRTAARHFEVTLKSQAQGIKRIQQWVKVLWTLASQKPAGATSTATSA